MEHSGTRQRRRYKKDPSARSIAARITTWNHKLRFTALWASLLSRPVRPITSLTNGMTVDQMAESLQRNEVLNVLLGHPEYNPIAEEGHSICHVLGRSYQRQMGSFVAYA